MNEPADFLPIAVAAVDLAARRIRSQPVTRVAAKGDRDMASNVDLAVEDAVRSFLLQETPDVGFVGEEGGAVGNPDLHWTLDPIDGTANFLHTIPLCAVSLALVANQRPVVGVIQLPYLDTALHAAKHRGAYSNGQRIHVRENDRLADAIVSIGDYAVGQDADDKNRLRIALTNELAAKVLRVRMLGSSAIDLAWVAEGRLDAAIQLSNHPWDNAAGIAIVREAGGVVVDQGGQEHSTSSTATIAVTPALRPELDLLLARVFSDISPPTPTPLG